MSIQCSYRIQWDDGISSFHNFKSNFLNEIGPTKMTEKWPIFRARSHPPPMNPFYHYNASLAALCIFRWQFPVKCRRQNPTLSSNGWTPSFCYVISIMYLPSTYRPFYTFTNIAPHVSQFNHNSISIHKFIFYFLKPIISYFVEKVQTNIWLFKSTPWN